MTSTGSGDPAPDLVGYYPAWLDHLADDVTLEGSMMDGYVQGAEAVRPYWSISARFMTTRTSTPSARSATTAGSRITPPVSAASRSRTTPS